MMGRKPDNPRERRFLEAVEKPLDEKAFRQVAPDPMFPVSKPAGLERPAWEYRTILGADTADLRAYGAEGWELVAVNGRPGDQALFYFRRPKRGGAA